MYTINLEDVDKDTKNVGRKASCLGELKKIGLNVPDGFIVTSDAFELFIKENNLNVKIKSLLSNINFNDISSVKRASKEIQNAILNGCVPKDVETSIKEAYIELSVGKEVKKVGGFALDLIKAGRETVVCVRPSPFTDDSSSYAGILKAVMNVRGERKIVNSVKDVWASLYTPEAIFYRKERRMDMFSNMGVIVQKMVNANRSGVVFSIDPIEKDQTKIVIEAGFGLGDPIVSGLIRPDMYIVNKSDGNIVKKYINRKVWEKRMNKSTGNVVMERVSEQKKNISSLNENDIKVILEITLKIEEHFKFPQNIEWCEERGKLFIVQTRPITGLNNIKNIPTSPKDGEYVVKGISVLPIQSKGKIKTISNKSELEILSCEDIILSKFFTIEMIPYLKKVRGIITDEGGITSIPSILAREFMVPLVFGTVNALSMLNDGQMVIIESDGSIYRVKDEDNREMFEFRNEIEHTKRIDILDTKFTATDIMLHLKTPQIEESIKTKIDGVGMLRIDRCLLKENINLISIAMENPADLMNKIEEMIGGIAKNFHPKPVWYRLAEMPVDEKNPFLGVRGFRFSYIHPNVFRCEIEALRKLYERGIDNIGLLIPFISTIDELRKAKEVIHFNIKLGLCIDTPASAISIEDFCKEGIDFVLVNLETLSQLILGVEKNHPKLSYLYTETSPAVIKLVSKISNICRNYKVKTSVICDSIVDPNVSLKIVETGIDSISVEPEHLEQAMLSIAKAERKILLKKLRE